MADDGTVGVLYYQLEGETGTTTIHLVHCHQGAQDCTTAGAWNSNGQVQIGSSFDITTAPNAVGSFPGDYMGLTDNGAHGFRPFFINSGPTQNMTDPFSDTVCPTGGC